MLYLLNSKKWTFVYFLWLLVCFACTQKKNDQQAFSSLEDSLLINYKEPQKAEKEDFLFDDFIYNFMGDSAYQHKHIHFPLLQIKHGDTLYVDQRAWQMDSLYWYEDFIVFLSDKPNQEIETTDSSLFETTLSFLNYATQEAKEYYFKRNDNNWELMHIEQKQLSDLSEANFLAFYHNFVSNETFQDAHLVTKIGFKTFDEETGKNIEGYVNAKQWHSFKPELPIKSFYTLNLHHKNLSTDSRFFYIQGISNGLTSCLHFKKQKGGWMLVAFEN